MGIAGAGAVPVRVDARALNVAEKSAPITDWNRIAQAPPAEQDGAISAFLSSPAGRRLLKDREFLGLAGWYFPGILPGHARQEMNPDPRNPAFARSPDPREWKTPADFLRINLRLYLSDSSYPCRRPTVAAYLAKQLKYSPPAECRINYRVGRALDGFGDVYDIDLDPARIFEVRALVTERGLKPTTWWGHFNYQLVRCDPARATVDDECRDDTHSHLVVSYAAEMSGSPLDSLRAVAGGLNAVMTLKSFSETQNQYALLENRGLRGHPLKLSDEQRRAFLNRALEQYWTYRGRYALPVQSCAIDALRLLKTSLGEADLDGVSARTPQGVLKALDRHGLLAHDPASAPQFYPSEESDRRRLREAVRREGKSIPLPEVDAYLKTEEAAHRDRLFSEALAKARPEDRVRVKLYFESLEEILSRRRTFALYGLIAQDLVRRYASSATCAAQDADCLAFRRLRELLDLERIYRVPGYGIPTAEEARALEATPIEEVPRLMSELIARNGPRYEKEWQAYVGTRDLHERMRASILSREGEPAVPAGALDSPARPTSMPPHASPR